MDTDLKFEAILKIMNKFREDITEDVMTKIPLIFEGMKTEVSSINEYLRKTESDEIKGGNKALKKNMEILTVKLLNTEQRSEEKQEEVRGSIDPAKLGVKVDNVRNINNGGIIIKHAEKLFAERDDDDVVEELINLNKLKDTFNDNVRIVKKYVNKRHNSANIILQVRPDIFKNIIEIGNLNVG
ncbi:hypothetical protein HHI36_008635 [Cryptolaemus montrouzieri]|uniref:Uncharacterized protein n=1 Tax=Cryptolaemus montrouzieri TaxID=559131 RepID=A0ABD2MTW6_9CUCU